MTDTPNRVGLPSRSTESLVPVARTDGSDGTTNEETNYDELSFSPNASPAGGLDDFPEVEPVRHDCTPHVYVVYWPRAGVIKIGRSSKRRWRKWENRGGYEIATIDTCCDDHAGAVEKWLLARLADVADPAYTERGESLPELKNGIGWTECYKLPRSVMQGCKPLSAYDYEAAYGLHLPPQLRYELQRYNAVWQPIARTA